MIENTKSIEGKLIVLEGGEATGKTTLMDTAQHFLEQQGLKVYRTRNPGGSEGGEVIRKVLFAQKRHPQVELHLFIVAILDNYYTEILPRLQAGEIVLSDRLYSSTIAYQIYGRQLNADELSIVQMALGDISIDLEIFLSADLDIRRTRIASRKNNNHFDEETDLFMQNVDRGYEAAFSRISWAKKKVQIVNNGTIEEAQADLGFELNEFLTEQGLL